MRYNRVPRYGNLTKIYKRTVVIQNGQDSTEPQPDMKPKPAAPVTRDPGNVKLL